MAAGSGPAAGESAAFLAALRLVFPGWWHAVCGFAVAGDAAHGMPPGILKMKSATADTTESREPCEDLNGRSRFPDRPTRPPQAWGDRRKGLATIASRPGDVT